MKVKVKLNGDVKITLSEYQATLLQGILNVSGTVGRSDSNYIAKEKVSDELYSALSSRSGS